MKQDITELNRMFAAYGAAACEAQGFEKGIALLLLLQGIICGKQTSAEDYNELLSKQTLGQLLRTLKEDARIDDKISRELAAYLKLRNEFVHHFFYRNSHRLLSGEICEVTAELSAIKREFENGDALITAMRRALLNAAGVAAEQLEGEVERMLDKLVAKDSN